jgi:tRNA(fMet)-specific endonuclease VapC
MRFMLDTNICIYVIKKKPPHLLQKLMTHDYTEIAVSSVTVAELEYGAAKSSRQGQNRDALCQFLVPFEILLFHEPATVHYGDIRADLEKRGQTIGAMDMLIAAHARSLNMILVTNNVAEFQRVSGLAVENWAEPAVVPALSLQ